MPRKNQPTVIFQPTQDEKDRLDAYCDAQQRSMTAVLRDLIRTLPDYREKTMQAVIEQLTDNA